MTTALAPRRRIVALTSVALLAMPLLAACSSASGTSSSAASTAAASGNASGQAAFAAYRDCLSQHGVTLPSRGAGDGPSGFPTDGSRPSGFPTDGSRPTGFPTDRPGGDGFVPQGVDPTAFAEAQSACASLRPTGGFGQGRPGNGPGGANDSALLAYRSCLKDHGVTATGSVDQLDTADPTTAKAVATCAPLKPSAAATPSPTATPSAS